MSDAVGAGSAVVAQTSAAALGALIATPSAVVNRTWALTSGAVGAYGSASTWGALGATTAAEGAGHRLAAMPDLDTSVFHDAADTCAGP
jgi:hypothetical protein